MKIKFFEETWLEVIEEVDEDGDPVFSYDEYFSKGEIVEGDVFDETETRVDFQFCDGSVVMGLSKSCFTVTEEK